MTKSNGFGFVQLPAVTLLFISFLFALQRLGCTSSDSKECPTTPTLGSARETADVMTMREHGWKILAAITMPVTRKAVLWETWATKEAVFSTRSLSEPRFLDLSPPKQFFPVGERLENTIGPDSLNSSTQTEIGSLDAMRHISIGVHFNERLSRS